MHEQSETIQRQDGKWVNVYGRSLPQAGQQLPGSSEYSTMGEAVTAAKARSENFSQDEGRVAHAMEEMERRAASGQLSPRAQEAMGELKRRRGITSASPQQPEPSPQQEQGLLRPLGVAATGFNKGVAGWVDLVNDGLKSIGLPMSDEPFMGTAFVDKYLAGAQHQPENIMESVLQRAGLEVGANVPLLGASGVVQAGATVRKAAGAMTPLTASTNMEALKNIPRALADELTKISPAKLAALESGIAAGAGTGAELVRDIFPEGGKTAEFVGELIGGFTPTVMLGLVRKAKAGLTDLGRVALGLESEDETQRRLGRELGKAATSEQIQEGVTSAERLRKEVSPNAEKDEGLRLSSGSAIKGGEVTSVERAEAKASIAIGAKLKDQRERNIKEIEQYFDETAPPGDPARFVETLQERRAKSSTLMKMGLDRTEMRLAAARGELSHRQAALVGDLEQRMQRADATLDARLKVIGPQLSPKQRQDVIRAAYDDEITKWRAQSRADYHELDMLGHAELPTGNTMSKLASLREEFPEQIQIIPKVKPSIGRALDNIGRDYELMSRAEKAQADLEAVGGKSLDQRGGFRLQREQQGQGGTQETLGFKSNYPDWYKSLANRKIAGTDNILDRETVELALDTIRTGANNGLHEKTIAHVKNAILSDSEFRKTPFFHPVMDELNHTASASLKDLRGLRSDLLAYLREARSQDNRIGQYVGNELLAGVDADIDRILPGTSRYADLYPQHGAMYRQVSADYREGVDTLRKGQVGQLAAVKRDGSYRVDEAGVPSLFWKDETSLDQFQKAFKNQGDAQIALRDHALDDLYYSTVKPVGGGKLKIDEVALERWVAANRPKLKAFPELEGQFRSAVELQKKFDGLAEEVKAVTATRRGEEEINRRLTAAARPGEFTPQRIGEAEARLSKVQDIIERTQAGWEMSKASAFLRQSVGEAANHIVTAKQPLDAYRDAVKRVGKDPEAVAGLNKAIWVGIRDSMEPKLRGLTGQVNLGAWHRALEDMLTTHGPLMNEVLGADGMKRVEVARDVIESIATGAKAGSDTAINLQVHAALASAWLSRAWATMSGRVPAGFGFAERAMQGIIKLLERRTAQQQEEILLKAFTDPKMFQTLVNAAQYGPNNKLVQHQMAQHLHAINMSEQMSEPIE